MSNSEHNPKRSKSNVNVEDPNPNSNVIGENYTDPNPFSEINNDIATDSSTKPNPNPFHKTSVANFIDKCNQFKLKDDQTTLPERYVFSILGYYVYSYGYTCIYIWLLLL